MTSLIDSMNYAIELTGKFILPVIDSVEDLQDCVKVLEEYKLIYTNSFVRECDFERCTYYDEGFLYVKTDDKELQNKLRNSLENVDKNSGRYHNLVDKLSVFDDPDTHKRVLQELDRRKIYNLKI